MELNTDFKELLALFNAHRVEYMIVGGFALAFHGAPRFTGDLDLFVKPDAANAQRIIAALDAFGFGDIGLTPEDFTQPERVVQLGVSPVRVDLITSLTGVSWEDASSHSIQGDCGGVPASFIARQQFIANKRALGRTRDLADVEALAEE